MTEDKIARICWNTKGWRKPSGKVGKSKSKKTYEYRVGFGHEEWLLDITKLINGWHYAYLQPIGLHRFKYIGKTFNISLYSINEEKKTRWWVGRILNVIVTTAEESREAYKTYRKNSWLREMEQQLVSITANVKDFRQVKPEDFAVVRFRPKDLKLLDTPMEFSRDDPSIRASYYILLNHKQTPRLLEMNKEFEFAAGHKEKKALTKSTYEEHSSDIDLVQNKIQTAIYRQLSKKFGKANVSTENSTGYGSKIDVVLKGNDGGYTFYEIKTCYSVRLCIRDALAQLFEYAYFPRGNKAKKLIIVSPNPVTPEAQSYLKWLREHFDIPLYYQRYDTEVQALEDNLY